MRHEITAVIMAGGKGTRLLPHTKSTPKPLVQVGERPIIELLIEQLVRGGVTKIHLAVSHLADQIKDVIGSGSRFSVEIVYSTEEQELSTIGPLKIIDNLPAHFLVVNGDILTDIDFQEFFQTHLDSQTLLTVATAQRRGRTDYGVFELHPDNAVRSFVEKPAFNLIVSTGIYAFSHELLALIPPDEPFGFDQLMRLMLKRRLKINTVPFQGYWMDIGRSEDFLKANQDIRDGVYPSDSQES